VGTLAIAGEPVTGPIIDNYGPVFAALESGIRKFDTSIAGLGCCPFAPGASGNVATEGVVMMLEQMGYDTGIDLDGLMRASELAKNLTRTA